MNNVFVNDRVHVRKSMCATCIFRPGNLMGLKPGRVKQMVTEAVAMDGCIPCHSNLGEPIEPVCRGFFDRHATPLLQVADRLGFVTLSNGETP